MRLRSGKNDVPEGNVVPRLHKRVHAIARTIGTRAQAANLSLRPACATQRNEPHMSSSGQQHWSAVTLATISTTLPD